MSSPPGEAALARRRAQMVDDQVVRRGLRDPHVVAAMRAVPRHRFVPAARLPLAYRDQPVPIGEGQTIPQPWVVARAVALARVGPGARALEIGTGSGYQAAILAAAGARVCSVELRPALAERAAAVLTALGHDVAIRVADGWGGWPQRAPFDAILLAAAVRLVPPALLDQLAVGGRLVAPIGTDDTQELVVIERTAHGYDRRGVGAVLFLPMDGRARD